MPAANSAAPGGKAVTDRWRFSHPRPTSKCTARTVYPTILRQRNLMRSYCPPRSRPPTSVKESPTRAAGTGRWPILVNRCTSSPTAKSRCLARRPLGLREPLPWPGPIRGSVNWPPPCPGGSPTCRTRSTGTTYRQKTVRKPRHGTISVSKNWRMSQTPLPLPRRIRPGATCQSIRNTRTTSLSTLPAALAAWLQWCLAPCWEAFQEAP